MTTFNKPTNYKGTGRPTKLTPELQDIICKYISDGNYLYTACAAVGITKTTYLHWLERAEREDNNGGGIYNDFVIAVKSAEAEAEQKLVSVVREKAINGKEWLPAMTLLERRHPDRWGRKDRTAITIDEHKVVTITHVEVIKDYGQGGQIVEGEARELPENSGK